jgi:hypothetical protein
LTFDWMYDWKGFLNTGIATNLSNHLSPHYFLFHRNNSQEVVMLFKDLPIDGI